MMLPFAVLSLLSVASAAGAAGAAGAAASLAAHADGVVSHMQQLSLSQLEALYSLLDDDGSGDVRLAPAPHPCRLPRPLPTPR